MIFWFVDMSIRLVMMGTGRFALPAFLQLLDSPHQVVGLYTQPDRTGSGHHRHVNPMKETALSRDIPVFQPANVNTAESLDELRALNADLCVVAAFGQILSADLLAIPRLGAINIHASLLPKYRGAAPIQHAIIRGETETGITIFQIDPRLDAGPMLGIERIPIGPRETYGQLEERLAALAAPLCRRIVDQLANGTTQPIKQDATQATRAPRLKKQHGAIDWSKSAAEIDCHVRGMQPWPTAYSTLVRAGGKPLRIIVLEVEPVASIATAQPGDVLSTPDQGLIVRCGDGAVRITRLQPEGRREMTTNEFLRGQPVQPGDHFTTPGV